MVGDIDISERNHEASEDEDRDGPLMFWIAVKLIFIATVMWYATPYP